MRKLKHFQTAIGALQISKFVLYHNNKVIDGEWNEFSDFSDAENYLLSNFHASSRPYQIIEFKTSAMIYAYIGE